MAEDLPLSEFMYAIFCDMDLIEFLFMQALVDAPDMVRGQMNFKRLSLTDIKIEIPRVPKKKSLVAAMEAAGNTRKNLAVLV